MDRARAEVVVQSNVLFGVNSGTSASSNLRLLNLNYLKQAYV